MATENDYLNAKQRLEEIIDLVDDSTPENDPNFIELMQVSAIIEEYELEHFPIVSKQLKTLGKKDTEKKKNNWAIPGQTVTHEEFVKTIKEVECDPFYSIEELKLMREKCRMSK